MIAPWAGGYVGLPFADRGRTRRGLDCWGLARLVLAEQFGRRLPPLLGEYASCGRVAEVAQLVAAERRDLGARRVADPEPGDLVLLRLRGHLCHVGVYVGGVSMLHVRAGVDAVVERLDCPRWQRRVEGYYRVR